MDARSGFLANSGTELNTTSSLYDLDYRNYDPALGRMNQVDPLAAKYSSLTPYNYSFNDPVTFTDPSGADPDLDSYGGCLTCYYNNGGDFGSSSVMDPFGGGVVWNPATAGGYGVAGYDGSYSLGGIISSYSMGYSTDLTRVNYGDGSSRLWRSSTVAWAEEKAGQSIESIGYSVPQYETVERYSFNFATQMRGRAVEKRFVGYKMVYNSVSPSQKESFKGWYFSFEHAKEAFEFMWESSFKERTRRSIREVAAWITDTGILIQPWEGPLVDKDGNIVNGFQRNSVNGTNAKSHNTYLPFDSSNMTVKFNGEVYKIIGQIHTHPLFGPSDNDKDQGVSLKYGIPIYNIHFDDIHDSFDRRFGTISAPSKDIFRK